ncbi:hypothetical protein [Nocardia sp. NPDC005998]
MSDPIEIHAIIGGKRLSRDRVHAWESRQAVSVLGKFAARLGRRAI